jgi:hypothetical protein
MIQCPLDPFDLYMLIEQPKHHCSHLRYRFIGSCHDVINSTRTIGVPGLHDGAWVASRAARVHRAHRRRGTDGSNLAPSTGESAANLTPRSGCRWTGPSSTDCSQLKPRVRTDMPQVGRKRRRVSPCECARRHRHLRLVARRDASVPGGYGTARLRAARACCFYGASNSNCRAQKTLSCEPPSMTPLHVVRPSGPDGPAERYHNCAYSSNAARSAAATKPPC